MIVFYIAQNQNFMTIKVLFDIYSNINCENLIK